MSRLGWTTAGSVFSAAIASACCWLPLLMVATGFSIAGASAFFERLRPFFLVLATVLLGLGFWLQYRPRPAACGPDGSCEPPDRRWRRLNRSMLWLSTVFVLALALFPRYVGQLFGRDAVAEGPATEVWVEIEGMTCDGCETAIEAALAELEGVRGVVADHERGGARVQIDPAAAPDPATLEAAVLTAGYRFLGIRDGSEANAPGDTGDRSAEETPEDRSTGALRVLDADFGALREHFNALADRTRLVALLSPT